MSDGVRSGIWLRPRTIRNKSSRNRLRKSLAGGRIATKAITEISTIPQSIIRPPSEPSVPQFAHTIVVLWLSDVTTTLVSLTAADEEVYALAFACIPSMQIVSSPAAPINRMHRIK